MPKLSIADKKAALQAQLDELVEKEKAEIRKQHAVIGRVLSNEMKTDNDLKNRIDTLLSTKLVKNNERELFGLSKIHKASGGVSSGG